MSSLLVAGAVLVSGVLALAATGMLAWVPAESGAVGEALALTVRRLALALAGGLLLGAALASLMRSSRAAESLLTPWLLAALAVPWVLVMIALNMIPNLGLNERTALIVAALATATQVWALGRAKLEERRETYLRRAVWYAFTAVLAGELLARPDGVGARLRFHALLSQADHVLFYVAVLGALWFLFALLGRLAGRVWR